MREAALTTPRHTEYLCSTGWDSSLSVSDWDNTEDMLMELEQLFEMHGTEFMAFEPETQLRLYRERTGNDANVDILSLFMERIHVEVSAKVYIDALSDKPLFADKE